MKITILNKNRINNTGSWELSNLNSYTIDAGFTITKNHNETLDSAVVRISHLTSKIDIEPFDEVLLSGDTRIGNLYFCIDDYNCIEESLDYGTKTYTYEINLFSQVKKLEGIILPNLSITPLRTGTKRSVWDYLKLYLDEYGEKIRVIGTLDSWQNAYNFDETIVKTRFQTIDAPELQWNAPTLREVLNDLTMVDNCVLTLNNGVLSILDLEARGNEITNYNYVRESKSSIDYVSDIRMNLQNALQTGVSGTKDSITISEYIPFTSEDYILTSDNLLLKTKYPILRVKSLKIITWFADFPYRYAYTIDIANLDGYSLIKEYNEYQTLPLLRVVGNYDPTKTGQYYSQYQNFCVYYTRGQNTITGFTDYSKRWKLVPAVNNFGYQTIDWFEMISQGGGHLQNNAKHYFDMFYIEYETTAQQTFSAGKSDTQDNYRVIVDNQTNSWVDAYTQGKLEYSKANRLSNKSLLINQRYEGVGNIIDLTDVKDDSIVYKVQYQIYDDIINVNAYATKDYILKDYFTGINSKIRTWVNAQNEAFERHDLVKYYCELGTRDLSEFYDDTYNMENYLLSPLKTSDTTIEPIQCATIKTVATEEKTFLTHPIVKMIGNAIVFTTGFDDNTIAGRYIYASDIEVDGNSLEGMKIADNDLVNNVVILNNHFYCDENFECANFTIEFAPTTTLNNDIVVELAQSGEYVMGIDDLVDPLLERFNLPLVNPNVMTATIGYELGLMKDNKEIPQFSFQYEFCCENRDIYFTKYFVKYQKAIRTETMPSLKVVVASDYNYNAETITGILQNTAIINVNNNRVDINNITNDSSLKGLYITDNDGNVLIGIKKPATTSYTFYINILKNRNKTIYNSNRVKIGEL